MNIFDYTMARTARILADEINDGRKLTYEEQVTAHKLFKHVQNLVKQEDVDAELLEPLLRAQKALIGAKVAMA